MVTAIVWATLLLPQTVDSRWTPWLGCFRLTGDEIRMPLDDPFDEADEPILPPRTRVCLTAGNEGIRAQTLTDGEIVLEDFLVADGESHPIEEGACEGWQKITWSRDGARLYTTAELTCEEGRRRTLSGVSMFTDMSTWVEIQSVRSGNASSVQVRRYRPVNMEEALALTVLDVKALEAAARARREVSAPLSTEAVIETARQTDSAAAEAAVMEARTRFTLDAEALEELDDAGVSPQLIDLMVALAYPDRFIVDTDEGSGGGGAFVGGTYGMYDPYYSSPFSYPYFYAPFGYYYWYAPYHPVYGVRPVPTPGASIGRVIAGRGYTQVGRRGPSSGGGGGGRYAKPRDGSGSDSGGGGLGSGSSGSSSSSATATPGGYTRSGSAGRSAKPKKRQN